MKIVFLCCIMRNLQKSLNIMKKSNPPPPFMKGDSNYDLIVGKYEQLSKKSLKTKDLNPWSHELIKEKIKSNMNP